MFYGAWGLCAWLFHENRSAHRPWHAVWTLCLSAVREQHAGNRQNVLAAEPGHPGTAGSWETGRLSQVLGGELDSLKKLEGKHY